MSQPARDYYVPVIFIGDGPFPELLRVGKAHFGPSVRVALMATPSGVRSGIILDHEGENVFLVLHRSRWLPCHGWNYEICHSRPVVRDLATFRAHMATLVALR